MTNQEALCQGVVASCQGGLGSLGSLGNLGIGGKIARSQLSHIRISLYIIKLFFQVYVNG